MPMVLFMRSLLQPQESQRHADDRPRQTQCQWVVSPAPGSRDRDWPVRVFRRPPFGSVRAIQRLPAQSKSRLANSTTFRSRLEICRPRPRRASSSMSASTTWRGYFRGWVRRTLVQTRSKHGWMKQRDVSNPKDLGRAPAVDPLW